MEFLSAAFGLGRQIFLFRRLSPSKKKKMKQNVKKRRKQENNVLFYVDNKKNVDYALHEARNGTKRHSAG